MRGRVGRGRGVAVVGAGPYGLAVAAHLRAAGVQTRQFGTTMSFWRDHMPAGMLLRSTRRASDIAAPGGLSTLARYESETGPLPSPMPRDVYIAYGEWYQRRFVAEADPRTVERIEAETGPGFGLTLDDGEHVVVDRVVLATGLAAHAYRPPALVEAPLEAVSHAADHRDLGVFAGRRVLVVGAGQTALESAALLAEAGCDVELVARATQLVWLDHPTGGEPPRAAAAAAPPGRSRVPWSPALRDRIPSPPIDLICSRRENWLAAFPNVFPRFGPARREALMRDCLKPAATAGIRRRVAGVKTTLGREVVSAEPTGRGEVAVTLDDGSARRVDHVLLGTGYRISPAHEGMLAPELVDAIAVENGLPRLSGGLESTAPGLHFAGAAAAGTFGPVMRFVVGSWFAAPAIARACTGRRQQILATAFRGSALREPVDSSTAPD
jgi:hypothetical protein